MKTWIKHPGALGALTLAVSAYLLSFFHRAAPAAIAGDLQASFNISGTQLGLLAAMYFYVYTCTQLPTGILADTLGPRRLLFGGGLIAAAGSLLFALAPSFALALAGRTLIGLGVSVTFIAMLKIIAQGFDDHRFATLVGVSMFIGNSGSVIAGAPLAWGAHEWGWRNVFLGAAALSFLLAWLSYWRIAEDAAERIDAAAWWQGLRRVLGNRATWPGFFANFGTGGAFFAFAGLWVAPFLMQRFGLTRAEASGHVSAVFLGFALGCLSWGPLSDALACRKPVALSALGLHVLCWLGWLLLSHSAAALPPPLLLALCFATGAGAAGFTLSWASAKEVNPPPLSGMATSLVNTGMFLGAAILQPLVGWVMEQGGHAHSAAGVRLYAGSDWQNALLLMAALAVFGWLATLAVRETFAHNQTLSPFLESPRHDAEKSPQP